MAGNTGLSVLVSLFVIQKDIDGGAKYAGENQKLVVGNYALSGFDPADGFLIEHDAFNLHLCSELLLREAALFSCFADVLTGDVAFAFISIDSDAVSTLSLSQRWIFLD